MKKMSLIAIFAMLAGSLAAQERNNLSRDAHIASEFFLQTKADPGEDFGALLVKSALFFLNTPYVGHTLEGGDEERLIINLRELDCTTFMETCMALSRSVSAKTPDFESYCRQLQLIRYRGGVIDGYPSRLHYITDWITDNTTKGVLEDVTLSIGGKPFPVQLSYMSSHANSYAQLKGHPNRLARIKEIEEAVNARRSYYYIPKQDILRLQKGIRNGDLICFTTSIPGMDVSHVGIAYWQDGMLTFVHASSTAAKVIVNPDSLNEYCAKIKSNTGIIVLRGEEWQP